MPTKIHDVRDVWAWDAGYCEPSFRWPLPSYRVPGVYGYFTHYKEMGHQHAVRRCPPPRAARRRPLPSASSLALTPRLARPRRHAATLHPATSHACGGGARRRCASA